MRIVVDSDALIKITKAGLKELVVSNLEIFIPKKVYEETVEVPKEKGFSDALEIDKNVNSGKIQIKESPRREEGELEVLSLYRTGEFRAVVSDDRKFLRWLDRVEIPYLTPSSLIVHLFYKGALSRDDALAHIEKLRKYISEEEYLTGIMEVKRWEK